MISIDDRDIKKLEQDLKTFANRAFPYASRHTVNSSAFKAQGEAKDNIRSGMVLRNRFTEQSVRVEQTRTLNVRNQMAIVGSIADYLETQEFGGIEYSDSGKTVAIATGYSAGQEGQQPRTRLPRRPNKMSNISLRNKQRQGATRKQRNLIAVRQATQSGNKYIYLDLGRRKGIFKVTGGKKRPKVKMVHDLTRTSVSVPRNPWLYPAVRATEKHIPAIYLDALRFQARRNNLF